MEKIKIKNNAFVYPMPMVLIGAVVEGRFNFMPVGWISRVNHSPPMIAAAMGKHHYTNIGIHAHGEFSVNVPTLELLEVTDYCGLVSGKKQDKSGIFELFTGELEHAPMIRQCAVTMECKLMQAVELPSNTLFIGEIVTAYTEEQYLPAAFHIVETRLERFLRSGAFEHDIGADAAVERYDLLHGAFPRLRWVQRDVRAELQRKLPLLRRTLEYRDMPRTAYLQKLYRGKPYRSRTDHHHVVAQSEA